MKFFVSLLALIALASPVFGDAASISAAFQDIADVALSIKTTVEEWNGGLLGTFPIITGATNLVTTIQKSTDTVEASEVLSEDEALEIAGSTADLITTTLPTLDTVVAAKPKFDKLLLGPVIYLSLTVQKSEITKLGEAVTSKLPEIFVPIAEDLLNELFAKYYEAIAVFKPF